MVKYKTVTSVIKAAVFGGKRDEETAEWTLKTKLISGC